MKTKLVIILFASFTLLLFGCKQDKEESSPIQNSYLDTLVVPHEMKGYELYSWQEENDWYFSVMAGTNRIKTYAEVISVNSSAVHLITVKGIDTLKLVLTKFPENEYISWIGEGWLQSSWGGNFGNLQLPPKNYIDEITDFCILKKLNMQVAN